MHTARTEDRHQGDEYHGETSEALVYAIKDIVVNPAGTGGTRFLSVSFGFEFNSPELSADFEEREPAVRDAQVAHAAVVVRVDPDRLLEQVAAEGAEDRHGVELRMGKIRRHRQQEHHQGYKNRINS